MGVYMDIDSCLDTVKEENEMRKCSDRLFDERGDGLSGDCGS